MKKIFLLLFVIGWMSGGCSKTTNDLSGSPSGRKDETPTQGNSYTVKTGMSVDQINQMINQAESGDTIRIEAGTYAIDNRLQLKPNITFIKAGNQNPVFDARHSTTELYRLDYPSTEVNGCKFSGITFWNITIYLRQAKEVSFEDCAFDYGIKKSGSNKSNDLHDAYIRLIGTENATVNNCVFSRRESHSGRGVWNGSGSTGTKITDNSFGDGGETGHFITAINDNSKSNSLISGNTILRTVAMNTDDVNDPDTDHGIYAHSFDGLVIHKNTIKGWPANGSGGAIKARNGQNLVISENVFHDSGILLYIYINPTGYQYLKNVEIRHNEIHLQELVGGMYGGIGYWRESGVTGIEESINIRSNTMPLGSISISASNGFNASSFNSNGGGVFNNDLHLPFLSLASGVNHSGNY